MGLKKSQLATCYHVDDNEDKAMATKREESPCLIIDALGSLF